MIKTIFLIASLLLPMMSFAKEKIVFLVNTKEHDVRGAVTAPYLDEYADSLNWEQIAPDATIYRIRANSNEELRKGFELFMGKNPDNKEIVGLFIRSHGERMRLYNEMGTFSLRFPEDLASVFAPVLGHFSADTRIVFNGCSVLDEMNSEEAQKSLQSMMDALQIRSGSIYTNHTVGYEAFETFARVNIFNKDIPLLQRSIAGVFFIAWPITVPISYTMRRVFNHGYLLQVNENESAIYTTDYYTALKPQLVLK